jgi:paraquat-inducible protein B
VESLVEGQKSQREWNERVEDKVDGQGETLASLETTAASLKKVTATHTRQLAAYGSNARKAAKAAAASVVTSDAQASAIADAATEDRHSIAIGK